MRTNETFEDDNLDLSQLWKRLDRTPPGAIISRSNGKTKEVKLHRRPGIHLVRSSGGNAAGARLDQPPRYTTESEGTAACLFSQVRPYPYLTTGLGMSGGRPSYPLDGTSAHPAPARCSEGGRAAPSPLVT
jgi:hypothetical protein